jgi:hypothetical protein
LKATVNASGLENGFLAIVDGIFQLIFLVLHAKLVNLDFCSVFDNVSPYKRFASLANAVRPINR